MRTLVEVVVLDHLIHNIKYQGGDTGAGIGIPFIPATACKNPEAANYLWHCNFQTEDGGDPLCAWEEQLVHTCTYNGLEYELECTDHSEILSYPLLLAVMLDDGCCMALSCDGSGCTDPTVCNYNNDIAQDDGTHLIH